MFLLDTNVVSQMRRPDRINAGPKIWLERQNPADLFLSAVTVLEFELGMSRLTRHDTPQAQLIRLWLENKCYPEFATRILPIDADVARRCARLHVPNPRPDRDAYIAATALVHGLTVVTRNTRDFEPTGVPLLDPWLPV